MKRRAEGAEHAGQRVLSERMPRLISAVAGGGSAPPESAGQRDGEKRAQAEVERKNDGPQSRLRKNPIAESARKHCGGAVSNRRSRREGRCGDTSPLEREAEEFLASAW